MPGTPIGSSSSSPKNARIVSASVASASARLAPPRTMRAAIRTKTAMAARRLTLARRAECVKAPAICAAMIASAAASMLRHGGRRQRFQASAQAASVGIHMNLASNE